MSITARPLPAGNAVRLYLTPPLGTLHWRVLRMEGTDTNIPTHDHRQAVVVADHADERSILDFTGLLNDLPYTWRAFYQQSNGEWLASEPTTTTPRAIYQEGGTDVQDFLRERIGLGIAVEIKRGTLKPAANRIPVITAPFVGTEDPVLPAISVHFDNGRPSDRFIGDTMGIGADGDGYLDTDGFLSRQNLTISVCSLNADERRAIRQAVLRILEANLEVMAGAGITLPEWSWADMEALPDTQKGGGPLFYANFPFSCIAPTVVLHQVGALRDTLVTATAYNMEPPRWS